MSSEIPLLMNLPCQCLLLAENDHRVDLILSHLYCVWDCFQHVWPLSVVSLGLYNNVF